LHWKAFGVAGDEQGAAAVAEEVSFRVDQSWEAIESSFELFRRTVGVGC